MPIITEKDASCTLRNHIDGLTAPCFIIFSKYTPANAEQKQPVMTKNKPFATFCSSALAIALFPDSLLFDKLTMANPDPKMASESHFARVRRVDSSTTADGHATPGSAAAHCYEACGTSGNSQVNATTRVRPWYVTPKTAAGKFAEPSCIITFWIK
jgi:hypothetical protein